MLWTERCEQASWTERDKEIKATLAMRTVWKAEITRRNIPNRSFTTLPTGGLCTYLLSAHCHRNPPSPEETLARLPCTALPHLLRYRRSQDNAWTGKREMRDCGWKTTDGLARSQQEQEPLSPSESISLGSRIMGVTSSVAVLFSRTLLPVLRHHKSPPAFDSYVPHIFLNSSKLHCSSKTLQHLKSAPSQ